MTQDQNQQSYKLTGSHDDPLCLTDNLKTLLTDHPIEEILDILLMLNGDRLANWIEEQGYVYEENVPEFYAENFR